jgi:hypothetical protein
MNLRLSSLLLTAAAFALSTDVLAQRSDLLPVQRRAASVDLAARIVEPRSAPALPATLNNPFAPEGFDLPDGAEAGGPGSGPGAARAAVRTLRDTLEVIAANITPTGTISRRGEPILLFGSKQVRVGEELTVTYEGTTYVLTVTAIQSTNFTVRLNNDELTRPIKPGAKP